MWKSILFYFLFPIPVFGIEIYLEAVDNFDGTPLEVEFRIQNLKNGKSLVVKDDGGMKYFDYKEGEEIQIKVFKEGYYPEERTIENSEKDQVIFRLKRRPTAELIFQVKEAGSNAFIPAEVEVLLEGIPVYKSSSTKNQQALSVVVTSSGEYTIISKSKGFADVLERKKIEVSSPKNIVEIDLFHAKEAPEVLVQFLDEQLGKPVTLDIEIGLKGNGAKVYQGKPINGEFKFTFNANETYVVRAKGAGFKEFVKEIRGPVLSNQRFIVQQDFHVYFDVLDGSNRKDIPAIIHLTTPSGKEITLSEAKQFVPQEKGDFKVVVESSGYLSKTGTILVNSLGGSAIAFEFLLEKGDDIYEIKIIDKYTRSLIPDADLQVFAQSGGKLRDLKMNKDGLWQFSTSSKEKYFIEIRAKDYTDFTKNLKKDEKTILVELFWKPELTYSIEPRDAVSGLFIPNASLKILDQKNQEVFVAREDKKFLAKLYKNQNYSYDVRAEGYWREISGIKSEAGNVQVLLLDKEDSKELKLKFQDALTNQDITAVDFKVEVNSKTIELRDLKFTYDPVQNYRIIANKTGYKPQVINQLNGYMKGEDLIIPLEKDFYEVVLVVQNLSSKKDHQDLKIKISSSASTVFNHILDEKTLYYNTQLPFNSIFQLTASKDGFEEYKKDFTLTDLLDKTGVLKPLVIRLKPKASNPAAVEVVEQAAEIKNDIDVYAILKRVPSDRTNLERELSSTNTIGKRYFLDQVNFVQSSPKIASENVEQLNLIAQVMKDYPRIKIEIIGYTDNVGDPRANKGLSLFRAKAVSNYLFNHGANPENIFVLGKGEENPIAPNDNEENKSKNRRVEMILVAN